MHTPVPSAAAALVFGVLPAIAAAQARAPQELSYGETVSNVLTVEDDTLSDGSAYKVYYFQATAGDSLTIYLSSRDFNTHLILADSADQVLNSDDNSGGRCNSYLSYVVPVTGLYEIFATASTRAEIGQYQLTLQRGIQPPNSRERCAGFLGPEGFVLVGRPVRGAVEARDRTLPDTSKFELWTLRATPGRQLTADLNSTEFDARLILVRGFDQLAAVDDDGGPGCNARLVFTPTDATPLRLVVVARPPGRTGSYTLSVSEGQHPLLGDDPCTPPGGDTDAGGA